MTEDKSTTKEKKSDVAEIIFAVVFILIIASALGLVARWQSIAADSYAECNKIRLSVIALQQMHPDVTYSQPSCFL